MNHRASQVSSATSDTQLSESIISAASPTPLEKQKAAPQSKAKPPEHLGAYGGRAMAKHLKKMMRHEAAVLKDKDIEELHQMRIGLRRLRTTLQTFEGILELPKSVQDARVKPLAKRLGEVRDLDVLLETLRQRHRPGLPKKERKVFDRLLAKVQKKRDRQFKRMKRFLRSSQYTSIKRDFKSWIKHPKFNSAGNFLVSVSLPDLLLPVLSQTLLHPGWMATPFPEQVSIVSDGASDVGTTSETVNAWLDNEGKILHDLRKQMKQLRYQADFFAPHYDATYRQQIKEFKTIQDLLGNLQDYWVLGQTLKAFKGPSWAKALPTLSQQIASDRWQTWQEWESIRQRYITQEVRSELRQIMLHPIT